MATKDPTRCAEHNTWNCQLHPSAAMFEHPHTHQYTIPVEWKHNLEVATMSLEVAKLETLRSPITVTKLMCQCGAEVERNTNG